MSDSPKFNYIITIHNKEDLIEEVLNCVLMCCRDNSHVYPVLDGCTDNTEKLVDQLINKFSGVPITKVYTADVHELLSINAGLKAANQEGEGYNIILQDDVILADFLLEQKVAALYKWGGPQLGYVSFRLGANFKNDAATSNEAVPYCEYAENAYGHGIADAEVLYAGNFAYRSVPIKSPVCIPTALVRSIGMFEERLAPYGHDDLEYSIRLIKAGYRNGVFPIRFYSDVKWGGTRTSPHPELNKIIERNMGLIRDWKGEGLADICNSKQSIEIIEVPNMAIAGDVEAGIEVRNKALKDLKRFQVQNQSNISAKVKNLIRKWAHAVKITCKL